jgi:hypothetical protein
MQQTCIMNAWQERGSDYEHFGTRIDEIRVTVVKIWRKEVVGTYLEFLESSEGYIWKYF